MSRILPVTLSVLVVVAVVALAQPGSADAQSHSATRSFQQTWAAPGSEFTVTIMANDYGDFGQVVEELPLGSAFVSASLEHAQIEVEGRTIRFILLGETSFTYRVLILTTEESYTFSGVIKNIDREEQAITGDTTMRVGPPPTPTPTLSPTAPPTPTSTLSPTAPPTPTPTLSPTAPPTSTSTLSPTSPPPPTPTPSATSTVTSRSAGVVSLSQLLPLLFVGILLSFIAFLIWRRRR